MPLFLWWKAARDVSHLHPEKKTVVRMGKHGEIQVFAQTFWVSDKQETLPKPVSSEELQQLLDHSGVVEWYDKLRGVYNREAGEYTEEFGITTREWLTAVRKTHEDLNNAYGLDRVAIFIPSDESFVGGGVGVALPYFTLLKHHSKATLTQAVLDKLELPYIFWNTFYWSFKDVTFDRGLVNYLKSNNEAVKTLGLENTMEAQDVNVDEMTISDTVIDPNSKKEILTDDYFKRLLPALEGVGGDIARGWLKDLTHDLPQIAEYYKKERVGYFLDRVFSYLWGSPIDPMSNEWYRVEEWVVSKPSVLKALLSFIMPAGDRDVALLALYAGMKTASELAFYRYYLHQEKRDIDEFSAQDIMAKIQEIFEKKVERGKEKLGLGNFPIPPKRVWETLWTTVGILHDITSQVLHPEHEGGRGFMVAPSLQVLLESLTRTRGSSSKFHVEWLREVVRRILGEEATEKKKFSITPIRTGDLGKVLYVLYEFGESLKGLGFKVLGENPQLLEGKLQALQDINFAQTASKATRRFHGALSSVIKSVQKVKDWFANLYREGVGKGLVAVLDYSPMGFYSLTKDGTCFGASNSHHPYLLSRMRNSFVLRVFAPAVGCLGRMWGVLDPETKTMYLTNHYGSVNRSYFKG